MKIRELFNEIDLQGKIIIYYYDEFKNKLVKVKRGEATDEKNIQYMYAKNDTLYIEIEIESI